LPLKKLIVVFEFPDQREGFIVKRKGHMEMIMDKIFICLCVLIVFVVQLSSELKIQADYRGAFWPIWANDN
jgi:hypothetical protein